MAKKDAMGQEVDSLYLSLGLNAADLEMGFQTAGQTVRQAMSRLNSEANQIRLKADIDVTRLEAAGNHVDALKAKEKALTDELAVQQKKLELLNRAYEANAKTYGKDHSLTRGVDTKRLYQTRDIERLKASIAQVNAELAQTAPKATGAFGKLGAAAAGARAKVEGVTGAIKGINAGIAAVSGAIAGGYGLFSITDKAMQSGENMYKLSQRLHTTTAEAGKLSKAFQLSGMDINTVTPLLAKLDKQALAAAKSSNDMAMAQAQFGFSLTNSQGGLLSTEQQLSQLAKGYANAAKAGREEEFVAKVLGARGAQLVPILQDWATNMEIVSRVKSTGLMNPQEAHELYIEWQALQMQAGQLTGAVGQALLPVAKDLMPEITAGFKEVVVAISDNKGAIKSFGSVAGDVIGTVTKSVGGLVVALGKVKEGWDSVSGLSKDEEVIRALGGGTGLDLASVLGGAIGALGGGRLGGTKGAVAGGVAGSSLLEDAVIKAVKVKAHVQSALGLGPSWEEMAANAERAKYAEQEKQAFEDLKKIQGGLNDPAIAQAILQRQQKAAEIQKQLEQELAETTNKRLKEQLEATKRKVQASIESGKEEEEAWLDVAQNITEAIVNAQKQAKEANEELEKSIYSLTHTDLQNTLHGFDLSAKASREKGADPALVEQEAQLKKSKAIEAFEKETAQYLDGIYADSLTQRLNQIEREKKAWIKKGMDEVQATRAAEQQKKQAVNDNIKTMFTSQKKYLDIYRRAMAGQIDNGMGGMLYDYTQNAETRQQNAVKMIQRAMMKEAGVDPWERTNMVEVQGFQRAMKGANDWGLSLMGQSGADLSEVTSAVSESGAQMTAILEQINSGVPEINTNLSQILGAIQQGGSDPPQINVNPTINVDLGGAYVFDNAMKKQLTDDITNDVARGVTSAVQEATSRINTGFAG